VDRPNASHITVGDSEKRQDRRTEPSVNRLGRAGTGNVSAERFAGAGCGATGQVSMAVLPGGWGASTPVRRQKRVVEFHAQRCVWFVARGASGLATGDLAGRCQRNGPMDVGSAVAGSCDHCYRSFYQDYDASPAGATDYRSTHGAP